MKVSSLIACLVCFSTIAWAAEDSKSIVVDRSAFSDVYPAVWFSPSTGEIAPLKERSETPPAGKYEIWIEPSDPEFGYSPEMKPGDVGFALVGKGPEAFENPNIPVQPKLDLKITHLMEEQQGGDGLVFYCRAKTSECLIMITEMDSEAEVMRFKWRPLAEAGPGKGDGDKDKTEPGRIVFDWTVVGDRFYLEVKNSTREGFMLDELFLEGYNVEVVGLDSAFNRIYVTPFGMLIQRAPATRIPIAPGRYHRTGYDLDRRVNTLPEDIRYIRLRWTRNDMGTRLPEGGLETSLYDLRAGNQLPGKPAGK